MVKAVTGAGTEQLHRVLIEKAHESLISWLKIDDKNTDGLFMLFFACKIEFVIFL